jgi:simple sugar transport system ATP-binding protein
LVDGRPAHFASPKDAMAAGIGMVTQEFSLVGPMTVTENVMLSTVGYGAVDRAAARRHVREVAARIGIDVDPDARIDALSVGERQRVEILKALARDCRVLVLDEPTAVLVPQDVDALFATIRRLTAAGLGVVLISHKLHEVVAIADTVTVIRRGRHVITRPTAGLDPAAIAALMVGADELAAAADDPAASAALGLDATAPAPGAVTALPPPAPPAAAPALELRAVRVVVEGVTRLDDVSLAVAPGEIVGVAGVSGNGQTELVSALGATTPLDRGSIHVGGRDVTALDVQGRLRAGLGRITEDRKGSVIPGLTVEQNLVLEDLHRFRRYGFTDRRRVREHARRLIEQFDIRAEASAPIRTLSGGNMQKVLLARALAREPQALVASQPTRGLDVGACEYVYRQLRAVRDRGGAVLLVSEDLDELFGLADRLVVLFAGRIVGDVATAATARADVGLLMTGHRAAVPA